MQRVIIESPFAGDVEKNVAYAKRAMIDSLRRGEAPFASHLLYPQVLNDDDPAERALGINAGFAWGMRADLVAVYADLGISQGMSLGIERATRAGLPYEIRYLNRVEDDAVLEHFSSLFKAMAKGDHVETNRLLSNPPDGVVSGCYPPDERET